jgi:hypothetical protein
MNTRPPTDEPRKMDSPVLALTNVPKFVLSQGSVAASTTALQKIHRSTDINCKVVPERPAPCGEA